MLLERGRLKGCGYASKCENRETCAICCNVKGESCVSCVNCIKLCYVAIFAMNWVSYAGLYKLHWYYSITLGWVKKQKFTVEGMSSQQHIVALRAPFGFWIAFLLKRVSLITFWLDDSWLLVPTWHHQRSLESDLGIKISDFALNNTS